MKKMNVSAQREISGGAWRCTTCGKVFAFRIIGILHRGFMGFWSWHRTTPGALVRW